MARIDFRSTTVADEAAIRALLQQAHGAARAHPMFESRHLHWKYWQPRQGWQGSRSYVLTRNGEIIAHAAVVPAVCSSITDRLKLLHVIDWAASADTRGAGNTLMQHIGTLADAIVTSEGDDAALRLLPFIGFAQSNTVVTMYARPLRPLLYLYGTQGPRWRLVARCLRNALWALCAPARATGNWRARRVPTGQVAAAAIPWPAPKRGTAVLERSASVMSYWLQCPAAPMELYAVESGSGTVGYFVLAFAPGQARLADCWLDSDAPAAWETLVQLAVARAAARAHVAEVAATCSEPLLAGALARCGFHARALRPLFVRTATGTRLPDAAIRIQMLDDDAAYRHSGARLLWA
jgi:hypothetical protein